MKAIQKLHHTHTYSDVFSNRMFIIAKTFLCYLHSGGGNVDLFINAKVHQKTFSQ